MNYSVRISDIGNRGIRAFRTGLYLWIFFGLLTLFFLFLREHSYPLIFTLIFFVSTLPLFVWLNQREKSLPILPFIVIQQTTIYALPLLAKPFIVDDYSDEIVESAGWSVAMLIFALTVGWGIGGKLFAAKPTRWSISISKIRGKEEFILRIGVYSLFAVTLFLMVRDLGILKSVPVYILSVLTLVTSTIASISGFLGGFIIYSGKVRHSSQVLLFWFLCALIVLILASSFLLSVTVLFIASVTLGIGLGKGRIPMLFVVIVSLFLGLLNLGKFEMREKYWNSYHEKSVLDLPSTYLEWFSVSLEKLALRSDNDGLVSSVDKGQSLLERIDNLQILLFVINAEKVYGKRTLDGASYTIIPELLVPRFIYPDKAKGHEAQAQLNLHFGRQQSVKETETTFIAWGILPESVGNFGPVFGPLVIGLIFGFIVGGYESSIRRKALFSVEGVIGIAVLLKVIGSYEMVASVFIVSTVQMVLVVFSLGYILHRFNRGSGSETEEQTTLSTNA